jgi:hypothetical protein
MPTMPRTIGAGLIHGSAVALLFAASATTFAQPRSGDLDESWSAAIGPDGVQRVNIRCGPDFLDPRNIIVKANVPLQLSVGATSELAPHSFTLAMGATTIDAPVGAAQRSFVIAPRLSGRFQVLCQDRSRPDSPGLRRAKAGTITVLP